MQGEGEREKEVGSWLGSGRPSVMCVFCAKDFVAAKLQALSAAAAAVVVDTQIAVRVCVYVCANIFALCCRPGEVWEGG